MFLAEDVRGEDVDDAEDGVEDACADDAAPHWGSEGFLGGGFLVKVPEDGDAQCDHHCAEGDKSVRWGE